MVDQTLRSLQARERSSRSASQAPATGTEAGSSSQQHARNDDERGAMPEGRGTGDEDGGADREQV